MPIYTSTNGIKVKFSDRAPSRMINLWDIIPKKKTEIVEVKPNEHIAAYVHHVTTIMPITERKEVEEPVVKVEAEQVVCTNTMIVEKRLLAVSALGETVPVNTKLIEDCDCEKKEVLHFKYRVSSPIEIKKIFLPVYASDTHKISEAASRLCQMLKNEFRSTSALYATIFMGRTVTEVHKKIGFPGSGKTSYLIENVKNNMGLPQATNHVPNIMVCPNNDLCLNNARRMKKEKIKPLFYSSTRTKEVLTLSDYGLVDAGGKVKNRSDPFLHSYGGKMKKTPFKDDALALSIIRDFDVIVMTPSKFYSFMTSYGLTCENLYADEAFVIGIESVIMLSLFAVNRIYMSVDPYQLPPHLKTLFSYIGSIFYKIKMSSYNVLKGSLFTALVKKEDWQMSLFAESHRFPKWYQDILQNLFYTHMSAVDVDPTGWGVMSSRIITDDDYNSEAGLEKLRFLFQGFNHEDIDEFNRALVPILWVFFKKQMKGKSKFNCLSLWERFYLSNLLIFFSTKYARSSKTVILVPTNKLEKLYSVMYGKFEFISTIRQYHGQECDTLILDFDLFMDPGFLDNAVMLDALSRIKFQGYDMTKFLALNLPVSHFYQNKIQPLVAFNWLAKKFNLVLTILSVSMGPVLRFQEEAGNYALPFDVEKFFEEDFGEGVESWGDVDIGDSFSDAIVGKKTDDLSLLFRSMVFDDYTMPVDVNFYVEDFAFREPVRDTKMFEDSLVKNYFKKWYVKTRSYSTSEGFFEWMDEIGKLGEREIILDEIDSPDLYLSEILAFVLRNSVKRCKYKGHGPPPLARKGGHAYEVCLEDRTKELVFELMQTTNGSELVTWPSLWKMVEDALYVNFN